MHLTAGRELHPAPKVSIHSMSYSSAKSKHSTGRLLSLALYKEGEQAALNEQTGQLPQKIADRILALVGEYEERSSQEAQLAHEADLLECLLQAREYEMQGYSKGLEWARICREGLQTDTARKLADACLNGDPGDWFQDLQSNPHSKKNENE